MITTLKRFYVRNEQTGNEIATYCLKLNGYTYELHSKREVICSGVEAERKYNECLELNRLIADKMGFALVEEKGGIA